MTRVDAFAAEVGCEGAGLLLGFVGARDRILIGADEEKGFGDDGAVGGYACKRVGSAVSGGDGPGKI